MENGCDTAYWKQITDGEFVNIYKIQLISYLEHRTAATYRACNTVLAPGDSFQDKLLYKHRIYNADALCHFKLSPSKCRRDIAMFVRIHRYALGKALSTSRRSSKHLRTGDDRHEIHARDI